MLHAPSRGDYSLYRLNGKSLKAGTNQFKRHTSREKSQRKSDAFNKAFCEFLWFPVALQMTVLNSEMQIPGSILKKEREIDGKIDIRKER